MHDSEYSQWLNRTGTEVLIERLNDSQQRERAVADLWKRIETAIMGRLKWIIGRDDRIDRDEVANQAFADVLEKHAEGKVVFHDRDGLLSLLVTILRARYIDQVRVIESIKRGGVGNETMASVSPKADSDEHVDDVMRDLLGIDRTFAGLDDVLGGGKPTKQLQDAVLKKHRACNQPVDSDLYDSQAGVDRLDLFLQGAEPDMQAVVREKVYGLPRDLRYVFELSAIQDYTQEQIATKLEVTREFVRYKLELIKKHWSGETAD